MSRVSRRRSSNSVAFRPSRDLCVAVGTNRVPQDASLAHHDVVIVGRRVIDPLNCFGPIPTVGRPGRPHRRGHARQAVRRAHHQRGGLRETVAKALPGRAGMLFASPIDVAHRVPLDRAERETRASGGRGVAGRNRPEEHVGYGRGRRGRAER